MTPDRSSRRRPFRFLSVTAAAAAISVAFTGCTSTGPADSTPSAATPSSSAGAASSTSADAEGQRIRLRIGDQTVHATLNDSPTARDLASRLPVTLSFREYNGDEKVAHIDPALTTEQVPESADPAPGDLGYYSPDANVVLYNGDVARYPGIVRIGRIDDVAAATQPDGTYQVTIEAD